MDLVTHFFWFLWLRPYSRTIHLYIQIKLLTKLKIFAQLDLQTLRACFPPSPTTHSLFCPQGKAKTKTKEV